MGVAIIGSVLSSIYASKIGDFLGGTSIRGTAATGIKESLGAALSVAGKLSKTAPDVAAALTRAANSAYVDGMHRHPGRRRCDAPRGDHRLPLVAGSRPARRRRDAGRGTRRKRDCAAADARARRARRGRTGRRVRSGRGLT